MMQEKPGGVAVLVAPEAAESPAWRARTVGEYEAFLPQRRAGLRVELAARVLTLTGRRVPPEDVHADAAGRLAVVDVDGTTLRLRGGVDGRLVVVRPCAYCGTGNFESPRVDEPADLGFALSAWVPLHEDCADLLFPEDLAAW